MLLMAAACSESPPSPPSRVSEQTAGSLASGLCSAIESVSQGDSVGAAELFTNDVHGPLHELAAEVEATDRAVAADVLIAKNIVETDIDSDVEDAELARDLRTLFESVKAGQESLGQEIPTCR